MAAASVLPRRGSSPKLSATRPQRGSRAISIIGAKVHRMPSAAASRAACRDACSTSPGSHVAACANGMGKMVLYPWITSRPKSSGMCSRLSIVARRCASARSAGLPAFKNEPHRPARISALMPSVIGVAIAGDCDICPIFSSSVIRTSNASTPPSILVWFCASRTAARSAVAAKRTEVCIRPDSKPSRGRPRYPSERAVTLSESISRPKLTAVELRTIGSDLEVAGCPRKLEIRPQRENDQESVDLRFNARPQPGGSQREVNAPAQNRWIRLADGVGEHGMNHIGFHPKCNRVGPHANRGANFAASAGKLVRVYLRERARPCDTGDSYVLKLLAVARVEGEGADCGLTFAMPRGGVLPIARTIAGIGDVEGFCGASDVDRVGSLDGIPHANIPHQNLRIGRVHTLDGGGGRHADDI